MTKRITATFSNGIVISRPATEKNARYRFGWRVWGGATNGPAEGFASTREGAERTANTERRMRGSTHIEIVEAIHP